MNLLRKYSQFIILGALMFTASCSLLSPRISCLITNHELVSTPEITLLWSKENIYILDNSYIPVAISTPNRFYLQATDTERTNLRIFAYETLTGALVWSRKSETYSIFVVDNETLTEGTHNGLILYDVDTGEILQKVQLPRPEILLYMYDYYGHIFAYGNGGGYFIYNKQEDQLISEVPNLTQFSFIEENNVKYVKDQDGFKAIDSNSETLLWKVTLEGGFSNGPIFTQDAVFILTRPNSHISNVYAVSKETGEILWKKSLDIISNIDVKDSKVYTITSDGYLVILDQGNGNELLKVKFSSQPFTMQDPNQSDKLIGAYTIAADPTNNVVIVSLGDSCQLLALHIKQ